MTVNYEQIANYLHNELPEAECMDFEAAMAADPALAELVNLYREVEKKLQGSIKASAGEAAIKQQLEALNQQYFGKKGGTTVMQMQPEIPASMGTGRAAATAVEAPVIAMRRRRMLYYVASAAAVLLVLLWIRPFGGGNTFNSEEVYAQFGAYEINGWSVERGGNSPADTIASLKGQVGRLFDMAPPHYAEALPLLEKLVVLDGKDPQIALAQAACYTETNDSARAMQTLLRAETQTKGELKDQATFYKAKLYIKYKDVEGCRRALQAITGDNSWTTTAQKLLKTLPKQ